LAFDNVCKLLGLIVLLILFTDRSVLDTLNGLIPFFTVLFATSLSKFGLIVVRISGN
jgi:hypothetical protein